MRGNRPSNSPWSKARMPSALAATLLLGTIVAGCGGREETQAVPLDDLVRFAERYDGQRISTSGVVRTHDTPEHYWIEDDKLNRVEVRPMARVEDLVGKTIRVQGAFSYSRDTGRVIRAEEVVRSP